ncbi:MAG: GspD family T2SS secretin variant ExeD [Planctomycetota bacterium]
MPDSQDWRSRTSRPALPGRGEPRRVPRLPLALAALALALAAPAQNPAGEPQGQPGQPNAQGQNPQEPILKTTPDGYIAFSFNETNGMELQEFIKWTERMTKKVFVYNDVDLLSGGQNTRINFVGTLRWPQATFKEEFYSFFQTMLYIKGFAVVPRGKGDGEMLEIIAMNGTRAREIQNAATYVTPDEVEKYATQTGVQILTSMPLKYINATVATAALRPFFTATGAPGGGGGLTLGNVGNNSAMLLQGFGPQVYAAMQLLKLVDVPTELPEMVIRVVQLVHAAPEEIEPLLNDVLNDRNRQRAMTGQNAPQGVSGAPIDLSNAPLKIAQHQAQRAIILSGTAEQVMEAMELIAKLDVPVDALDSTVRVIRLKNVLAEELVQTLSQFMTEDQQAEQTAQQGGSPGSSQARRPRKTVIKAHKESNSLLVSASQTKFLQVLNLIDSLDKRQPQVLVEAALVELTTGDLLRLGVELGAIDLPGSGSNYRRPFGFTSFGQSTFQDTDDNGLPDTRLPDFDNPLQGITGGIISGKDFAVPILINALQSNDRANILSTPSILVNNNFTAVVKTEESRPTLTSQQGTATTSQSVGQPRTAGITLSISPTIGTQNNLRLNVNLSISRFVGAFDPNSATGGGITLSREISTQVTMPSDDTMVLGGVIEDQESQNDGGIPILKDIPLLGYLFRKSESTSNKTNLYFFVTPTILDEDDFQDLFQVSLQRKQQAANYIGTRRMQMVDRKWLGAGRPSEVQTLDDPGATVEDLDHRSGNEAPLFRLSDRDQGVKTPQGPLTPGASGKTGGN